jgi:predicted helicase
MFGENKKNTFISFNSLGNNKGLHLIATNTVSDLHLTGDSQTLPLYHYDSNNKKHENITDWALNQFQERYAKTNGNKITKEDIFYYVYAVLHCPEYRKKYEQNLKREFPRLPFYDDFFQWRDWGRELMDLHINYETQEPFPLERINADLSFKKKNKWDDLFSDLEETENETFTVKPRTKLRANKAQGVIEIDTQTTLKGVPPLAWEYKLGNRSALEWILDQYKERKPKDATIAERFNTYKFEDYREQVIDLLKRIANVSIKTMKIINQMPKE